MDKQIYWLEKVQEYKLSGKSMSEYCRSQGISPSTFDHWKRKLINVEVDKGAGFIKLSAKSDLVELELERGVKIKVSEENLKKVLGALNAI